MKALIDILTEEKSVVRRINRLDNDIKSRHEYYEHVLRAHPDCEAKERDLEEIIIEIDIIKTERSKELELLKDVRNELSKYLLDLTRVTVDGLTLG